MPRTRGRNLEDRTKIRMILVIIREELMRGIIASWEWAKIVL